MSIWSVIDSRCLPSSWELRVGEVVDLLLARGYRICSGGVVAFVSGCSAGCWFTVGQAIRPDLAVVVFPVDGPKCLHHFVGGSWVPCRSLAGAYVFTFFEKEQEVHHENHVLGNHAFQSRGVRRSFSRHGVSRPGDESVGSDDL